ncbi:uncharacterized protein [Leptinotarsa decemlineata]|uniref:uncharacterized protein n=1 Tax=Leptinotarsa decemlineata TaxID=7539 RepID=UPI003D30CDD8
MPPETAEDIRHEVAHVLKTQKPPKSNLPRKERNAFQNLKKNKNIIITPADKGNATVVMNTTDYQKKMMNILQDGSYKPSARDPTTYLEKTTKAKIQSFKLGREIEQKTIPREKSSKCPKLYGLPKIHKTDVPLRPIVSAINSPTQNLEKYLSKIMQPKTELAEFYVRNSEHLVDIIKNIKLNDTDLLASLDIKSLYPSIPINEALATIRTDHSFPQHVTDLAEHCLKNTYFIFDKQIYKQVEGAPMGSSLSPVIANLFMMHFEKEALNNARLKPTLWKRYVDDIFIIWPHGKQELDRTRTEV